MRPWLCALALMMTPVALAGEPPPPAGLEVKLGAAYSEGTKLLPSSEMKVGASSELCEGKGAKRVCHAASRLVDGKDDTAWCEGAAKDGQGQLVTFEFKSDQEVVAVNVVPYYAKDMRRAISNARPERVLLQVDSQRFELTFPDFPALVSVQNSEEGQSTEEGPCGDETCASQDERIKAAEPYRVTLPAPVKTRKLSLTLLSTHAGDEHPDTCISEVSIRVR